MRQFKDNAGRDWNLAVNVAGIKRLRDLLDVDLMQVIEGDLLQRLYADPILLVDVDQENQVARTRLSDLLPHRFVLPDR